MKVSVLTITYNQEQFIAQTVESALQQVTAFDYEIVIAEDCSTDATRDIVRRLAAANPGRVRLILNDRNLGMHQNSIQAYFACQGEYVAVLEGDDYWTSPHKLQRQADFLDKHPECVVCFHDALVTYEGVEPNHPFCRADQKAFSNFEDVLQENFVPTCSIMYRNRLLSRFPDWWSDLAVGDWPFLLLHARHGTIGYLKEVMAVHRKHPGGAWTRESVVNKARGVLAMYDCINRYFDFEYDGLIRVLTSRWRAYWELEVEYLRWKQLAREREDRIKELEAQIEALTRPAGP
jgi:glycosyltransferase involved in cell wall biosynthesis